MEGGMVELKIEQLIAAIQSVLQRNNIPGVEINNVPTNPPEHIIDLDIEVSPLSPIPVPGAVPDEPGVSRRPTRKRTRPTYLEDYMSALAERICGNSADPQSDSITTKNAACCKMEDCQTKWYHLACLERGSVPENWICDACISTGGGREKRRRGG
ncbi:hypothetical protein B0H16DRAFT_1470402 [Mycena metata]|uniref:Zinc finger PHD-type domain-containing protein n=1 Tax=Mycena metata TaxID=1033252 RepID=A0AAD7HUF8_9AGAR|nr:hypothetical protein B0H16DRAFT_1470402 [Mycena metata]